MLFCINEGLPTGVLLGVVLFVAFLVGMIVYHYLNYMVEELPKDVLNEELDEKERVQLAPFWNRFAGRCKGSLHSIFDTKRHTVITLLGGVLTVFIVLYYGITLEALTVFFAFFLISAIAFVDMDTQYIPPELNIALAVVGVVSIWTLPGPTILERLIGVVCVSVPMLLIVLLIPEGFGFGDIKMMAAVGVLLGWKGTIAAFFIGVVIGGIFSIYLVVKKKKGKKYHFAFGPFLSIGVAISLFAGIGANFVNQYIDMLVEISKQQY